jgi:hypothetical protein
LLKNRYITSLHYSRWLKNNGYNIIEDLTKKCIRLEYIKKNDLTQEDKKNEGINDKSQLLGKKQFQVEVATDNNSDPNLLSDEELYLRMPCI